MRCVAGSVTGAHPLADACREKLRMAAPNSGRSMVFMNSDLAPIRQPAGFSIRSKSRIPVVAVHDGPGSAPRVQQAREQMQRLLGGSPRVQFYSWAFHHLEALDVRAMARHIAEAAPLILLASADGRPPEQVERWLDQSLIEQEEERALLVALEDSQGQLCSFTGRLASRWSTRHVCATQLDADPQREWVLKAFEKRLNGTASMESESADDFTERPAACRNTAPAPTDLPVIITAPHLREEIRMRAYHLWLHAGRPHGQELDFWLRAEREFLERQSRAVSAGPEHW